MNSVGSRLWFHVKISFRASCFTQIIRLGKPITKNEYNQRRKWRRINVVSKSIRFLRTFWFSGVPSRVGAEWQWSSRKRRCSDLCVEMSDSKAHIIIQYYAGPRWLFSDPKMRDHEWPLNVIFKVFCVDVGARCARSTRLPCLAYTNVPLSTYCKIRYVSKFTASSRGSTCLYKTRKP